MLEIKNIIEQLQNTSGRNDKELILIKNKDNQLLKDILYFVYNPYIVTGIAEKKLNKLLLGNFVKPYFNSIIDCMEYLQKHNTGRDKDIERILDFIDWQPEEIQDLLKQIFTKSLKIGCTAKTLNKIYGKNFIPQFEVMLAYKYDDFKDKINKFIITKKLDGNRAVIIKKNNKIDIFSRKGQPITGLVDIIKDAEQLLDNMVYDGEILNKNINNLDSKDLFQETQKIIRKKSNKKTNLEFNCFDIIPLEEFKKGKSKLGCYDRKIYLHEILNKLKLNYIIEVPILYVGTDKSMIDKFLQEAIDNNEEGIMLNSYDGKYECKRTKNILKVKVMNTCDLEIIDFQEGTGKNIDTLGAVIVDYKGYEIGVGSGFTDLMRNEIWNNKNKYINKIIEVQYFEETKNQNGGLGLRFPVFKKMRLDKIEPSYN